MLREIVPEETGPGIVHNGKALLESVAEILGTLTSSINNGPNFFDIVGTRGSIGPEMAVGGDFSAIIKVVEHSELQREFVLVGRNLSAIHGQRGIAVARRQIAENLIVSAIFLENVDHMANGIFAAGKRNLARVGAEKIVFFNPLRVGGKILIDVVEAQPLDRAADQCGDVRMLVRMQPGLQRTCILFGPLPLPLAVAMNKSFPAMARALGYHSVGMKPVGGSTTAESDVCSSCLVSNTATALSEALAA